MSRMTTETGKALFALMIVLVATLLAALPAMAETNESVIVTQDETVNVSVTTTPDDRILPFPQGDDTLFSGGGYLLWETDLIGNNYRISIGLVSEGMEVNSSNAEWVVIREIPGSDYAGNYYTWYPPSMSGEKYSLILLIDYEVAGMGRGTYNQETFITEGPFFLIDPYDPLDDPPDSPSSPPSPSLPQV